MKIRLLFATPDATSLRLFESVLASALELTPLDVTTAQVGSSAALFARLDGRADDVILLDWLFAQEKTPALVREILTHSPKMRIVAVLPQTYRQYRSQVWQAGACSSVAKENMEQEWLSSVLCIMHRAMQREARLVALYEARLAEVAREQLPHPDDCAGAPGECCAQPVTS